MKVVSTILLVLIASVSYSQGVFNNTTNSALQKVIEDYPNKFSNIKGDLLAENIQTIDFTSKVQIPGIPCVLTQYSSTKKAIYSWRADLLEEEEFEEAKKRYKELYNQIRNTIIKIDGEKPFILNGAYQAPTEDRKFNVVNFQLLPSGRDMEKLQIELSMSYMVTAWKITLTVYEREYRDDERITATDLQTGY
ncbi:MAG: hypothetical protein EOO02_02805 [Chitinophagaceae bacterium]|nr:MAG: hypothetical protein EOO02_02805 [Chitinophagaceae bacterium]